MICISGKAALLACALTEPPVKKAVARCWNVLLDCVALSLISLVFFLSRVGDYEKPLGPARGENKKKDLTFSGWVTYTQAKSLSTGVVTPKTRGSRTAIQRGTIKECDKGKGVYHLPVYSKHDCPAGHWPLGP